MDNDEVGCSFAMFIVVVLIIATFYVAYGNHVISGPHMIVTTGGIQYSADNVRISVYGYAVFKDNAGNEVAIPPDNIQSIAKVKK